jgi:Asp/Glu/hydantoin racemase
MTDQASRRLLLINPNSSVATTDMMVAIAQDTAGEAYRVAGATATRSPPMIVEPRALAASAAEVIEIALAEQDGCAGVIVSAFGDPGLDEIRTRAEKPAVGICESSMREAADGGRRFGVATTTPDLLPSIDARAREIGLGGSYTGTRLTDGDPHALVAEPERLRAALAKAIEACVERDGAQAVIIGGGPLARSAAELQPMFPVPIIAPIPAAVRRLIGLIAARP